MIRARILVALLVALVAGNWLFGQDAKTPVKVRGQLPPYWAKLGLSDEQRTKAYSIMADYRTKVAALEDQIKQLQKQQLSELGKVLTDSQKARLREILAAKSGVDLPSKDSKKDEKKKSDN